MRTPRTAKQPATGRDGHGTPVRRARIGLGLALLGWLTACGAEAEAAKKGPGGPVPVGVVTVAPTAITLTRELPGRTSAYRVAEVRARVNGIVQSRKFKEGSDVKEGDVLFEIDAQPYQASLSGTRATLARAEANLAQARLQASRVAALAVDNVASKEEQDQVRATLEVAEAEAASARASVKTARITVGYTRVTAPISGRIGRSEVTEGAFVQQTAATLMATIQQLDPIYVDLTQSTAELLRLRRGADGSQTGPSKVTLLLEDGRVYGEPGTLQFADVTVDESTGSISLRALFPNPRGELLPGMFVRARLEEGTVPQALLVPQRAVSRDPKGQAFALVVNSEKKVERRPLVTDRVVGDAWLVTEGLTAGEQVIVDGLQKVRPGAEVVPTPAEPAPAKAGGAADTAATGNGAPAASATTSAAPSSGGAPAGSAGNGAAAASGAAGAAAAAGSPSAAAATPAPTK